MEPKKIDINLSNYNKIKKAYNQAIADKKQIFYCFGTELLVDYAKYLLEYMEDTLKIKPSKQKQK
jgi:ABC-type transporter MlaC component